MSPWIRAINFLDFDGARSFFKYFPIFSFLCKLLTRFLNQGLINDRYFLQKLRPKERLKIVVSDINSWF